MSEHRIADESDRKWIPTVITTGTGTKPAMWRPISHDVAYVHGCRCGDCRRRRVVETVLP